MEFTLVLTIGLVVMVIFLFLRNLTATLIPGSAVVLSIVGTFAVMYLLGYSLNTLSLMALTLSVGFVVDDAIVMLENIVRYMEMGKSRYEAAMLASKEIGFTIVSMTLSLVAVFIPVLFLGGMVGRLLHEFSVTIIVAILISGFVSLTFTPMLGSRFLPPHDRKHGGCISRSNADSKNSPAPTTYTLRAVLRHRLATMVVAAAMLAGTVYLFMTMPTGFLPSQDSGFIFGVTMAGQDISFESMAQRQKAVADILQADQNVVNAVAFSSDSNVGFLFSMMKPRAERELSVDRDHRSAAAEAGPGARDHDVSSEPAADHDQRAVQHEPLSNDRAERESQRDLRMDAEADGQDPHAAGIYGCEQRPADREPAGERRYRSRSRAGAGRHARADSERAVHRLWRPPGFEYLRAGESILGDSGSASPKTSAARMRSRSSTSVRSSGQLVPLDAVARVTRTVGPLSVNHFGQLPAATISFNLQPGFSLGEAASSVDDAVRELRIPASVTTSFQGTVKEFQESFAEPDDPADRRDSGDLHRARASCTRASFIRSRFFRDCPRPCSGACLRWCCSTSSSTCTRLSD